MPEYKILAKPDGTFWVLRNGRIDKDCDTVPEAEAYITQAAEDDDMAARYDAYGSPYSRGPRR